MPSLQFKGKNIIWNHHLAVPFHTLDEVSDLHYKPGKANGNMIIEGDNLIALKALLPQFAGKVKCIYIDPPYNTGNEGWVYNDKVNSPLINDWIGKQVGIDDLTRHDKWLCMIVPRLKLLRDLLTDEGVICISIDDNELQCLRIIMNEIFGEENFIASITVENDSRTRQYDAIGVTHEYIIVYSKTESFSYNPLIDSNKKFQYEDSDGGFDIYELRNRNVSFNIDNRPNLYYPFWVNPNNPDNNGFYEISLEEKEQWIKTYPQESQGIKTVWRWGKDTASKNLNTTLFAKKHSDGFFQIVKKYRGNTYSLNSVWTNKEIKTDKGTLEIKSLFENKKIFDFPKPTVLVKILMKIFLSDNSIVLDSFAGSGTTMHAVMDLNKEDGGSRKCVMVQMTEATEHEPDKNICKDITRERVKRAIDKFGYESGFKYFRVGIPLDAETMLAGQLPTYKQFAKYIYYLCTGENLEKEDSINEEYYFVGEFGKHAIYLVYKQDYDTLTRLALNLSMAERIKKEQPGKKRIVYAPSCFLDEEYLTENQIDYVGIPYNLFQRTEK
jgi:adenine-specific DNA-methyltransferase